METRHPFLPQKAKHLYLEMDKKKPDVTDHYLVFEKYDGWYGFYDTTDGHIRSRNSRIIPSLAKYSEQLRRADLQEGIYIFEIMIKGYEINRFHELNGILNRKAHADDVYLQVHDYLHESPSVGAKLFKNRFKIMFSQINKLNLEWVRVATPLDVIRLDRTDPQTYAEGIWALGGEGIILKAANAAYQQDKRNSNLVKIKEELTLEMLVVGIARGKSEGKYANTTGALEVIEKSGQKHLISGMTDEQRDEWHNDPKTILNRVVEVKAMKRLKDGSLREPRFKAIRYDKDRKDID